MTAHYFEFGMPPIGECVSLCEGQSIPSEVATQVSSRYEEGYPGVYILAACSDDWFCLYDRTRGGAWKKSVIRCVQLDPVAPAKGPGYILVSLECTGERIPVSVLSSGFNDRVGRWMEERAEIIAAMIGVPYERLPPGADA